MQIVQLGNHRLRIDWRPGAGTPLVICNGWGSNIEVLDPLVAAMGNRPTLRFDAPGFGSSERPALPLRMPELAGLIEALFRQLRLDTVDVAGYSLGGALAQELAKRNPGEVRRLILMATTTGHVMVPARPSIMTAFADHRWLTNWAAPSRFFERDFACRVGHRLFGGEVLRRNPMAILPLLRKLERPSAMAMLWQVAGAVGWTSLPWIRRLRQPTLVLAGRHDRVINPLNPIILRQLIPNARLEWIDGGHLFPVLDAPAETARRMTRFLDEERKVIPLSGRRKQPARWAG